MGYYDSLPIATLVELIELAILPLSKAQRYFLMYAKCRMLIDKHATEQAGCTLENLGIEYPICRLGITHVLSPDVLQQYARGAGWRYEWEDLQILPADVGGAIRRRFLVTPAKRLSPSGHGPERDPLRTGVASRDRLLALPPLHTRPLSRVRACRACPAANARPSGGPHRNRRPKCPR